MKQEELQVFKYLKGAGYSNIQYEPDGNIPPDFLINRNTAIEVRRLNKHVSINGIQEPIEKTKFQVQKIFNQLVRDIKAEKFDHSIFLIIRYERPLEIKEHIPKIKSILVNHLNTPGGQVEYTVTQNLSIRTFPASSKLETVYLIGMLNDFDTGAFIVGEIYQTLPMILKEKEEKIRPYKDRYGEWWLVLVDMIGYGFSSHDLDQFKSLPKLTTKFDKVLLVSPIDDSRSVVIIDNYNS